MKQTVKGHRSKEVKTEKIVTFQTHARGEAEERHKGTNDKFTVLYRVPKCVETHNFGLTCFGIGSRECHLDYCKLVTHSSDKMSFKC